MTENTNPTAETVDFNADMEAMAQFQQEQLEAGIASGVIPSCDCGAVVGEHNLGLACHICGTKCLFNDESRNPVVEVQPTNNDPTHDYLSFEQFLNLMRQMHAYETMPPKDALQFDNACVYRWRDIKSLRLMFDQVETGGTNPISRFTNELRRVNDLLDSSYLELSHLRRLIGLEIAHYKQLAARARNKKQSTLSMQYTALATRLSNATIMQGRVRQSTDVQELNTALRNANALVDQLSAGIAAEAQECYKHVGTKREAGDVASADRHQVRGDRLMSMLPTSRQQ